MILKKKNNYTSLFVWKIHFAIVGSKYPTLVIYDTIRAVARFLYWGGGKLGQYKFINQNYYTKILNCIENFKAFLRVLKTINMSIILESFAIF